jgi:hypothetical protein
MDSRTQKTRVFTPIPPEVEQVGKAVLNAAFRVHTALGPGLLESVYEACLAYEIRESGSLVETQLLTYLRLTGVRLGFLINFTVPHLKDGIKRMVV